MKWILVFILMGVTIYWPGTIKCIWLGYTLSIPVWSVVAACLGSLWAVTFIRGTSRMCGKWFRKFLPSSRRKKDAASHLEKAIISLLSYDPEKAVQHAMYSAKKDESLMVCAQCLVALSSREFVSAHARTFLQTTALGRLSLSFLDIDMCDTQAESRIRHALSLNGENTYLKRLLFFVLMQAKRFDEAYELLSAFTREKRARIAAWFFYTKALSTPFPDRLYHLKSSHEQDKLFVPTVVLLAQAFHENGDESAARLLLEKSFALRPSWQCVHAYISLGSDDPLEQLTHFYKLLNYHAMTQDIYVMQTVLLLRASLWHEAEESISFLPKDFMWREILEGVLVYKRDRTPLAFGTALAHVLMEKETQREQNRLWQCVREDIDQEDSSILLSDILPFVCDIRDKKHV